MDGMRKKNDIKMKPMIRKVLSAKRKEMELYTSQSPSVSSLVEGQGTGGNQPLARVVVYLPRGLCA